MSLTDRLLIIGLTLLAWIAFAVAQTGSPKSVSDLTTEINSNLANNTSNSITPALLRQTVLDMANSSTNLITPDQTIAGGANITTAPLTTGNVTVDCGLRPIQSITDGGAFTITAPVKDGSCLLLVTNNASAGAVSFSGFSEGSNTGDALDTTNGHKFTLFIWSVAGTSGYRVAAHQ